MASNSQIPTELHEEILQFLPSNILFNFRRVCKDWNQLISSPRFVQKHLHKSRSGCNGTLIITLSSLGISVYDDPIEKKIRRRIPYPPGFSLNDSIIVGSCDGLVCLVGLNRNFFSLINPSTGKCSVRTTEGDGFVFNILQRFWFGRHPCTGEYLIVAIEKMSSQVLLVCQISNRLLLSQRLSTPPSGYFIHHNLIFLNGALHWYGKKDEKAVIFAYDIQKNKLLEIAAPPFDARLGIMDGCLFGIVNSEREGKFELWIMKAYGESWTKYPNIEGYWDSYRRFLPDGDPLLDAGNYKTMVKYCFSDRVHVYRNDYSAVLCVDSLVSP